LLDNAVIKTIDINDRNGDFAKAHRVMAGHLVREGRDGGRDGGRGGKWEN
jgi:hypothetical protein